MTFEQAGVKDGDTVEVQVDGQGARRTRRKG
jgi:antitoxin component of MazEF toxin-antitoxin module